MFCHRWFGDREDIWPVKYSVTYYAKDSLPQQVEDETEDELANIGLTGNWLLKQK